MSNTTIRSGMRRARISARKPVYIRGTALGVALLVLLSVGVTASLASTAARGHAIGTKSKVGTITIKAMVGSTPNTLITALVLLRFKGLIQQATKNQVQVQIYSGSALGTPQNNLDQTKSGVFDLYEGGPAVLSEYVPAVQVFFLPYLFKNDTQFYNVVDGPVGKQITKSVLLRTGLLMTGMHDLGPLNIENQKHVVTLPSDLKGLKIRVQAGQVFTDTLSAEGGSPTPMSVTEAVTALQTGAVDGANWGTATVSDYGFPANYLTVTNQQVQPGLVYINDAWLKSLPAAIQTEVLNNLSSATAYYRKWINKYTQTAESKLIARGVTITHLTAAQLAQWKASVQSLYSPSYLRSAYGVTGLDWVDAIKRTGG